MFELDDEYAESDIPTTLMRSKADCPEATVSLGTSTLGLAQSCIVHFTSHIDGNHLRQQVYEFVKPLSFLFCLVYKSLTLVFFHRGAQLLFVCLSVSPSTLLSPSLFSQVQTTLSTNDIVINKLTQILSYLRQGRSSKKSKKRDKGKQMALCLSDALVAFSSPSLSPFCVDMFLQERFPPCQNLPSRNRFRV